MLIVKPNALYSGMEEYEEPPYQYVPAGDLIRTPSPGNALEQSMLLLADGLASGALIARYEVLYRKHPDLTCDVSAEKENINKNRYRDISPCKFSQAKKVILTLESVTDNVQKVWLKYLLLSVADYQSYLN